MGTQYKSLFNTFSASLDITVIDNLQVNNTLDLSTASITGDTSNWSSLQASLDTHTNNINTNASNISLNTTAISDINLDITTINTNISDNLALINTNIININAGTTGIYNNSVDIANNTISINAGLTGIYNNSLDIATNTININAGLTGIATNTININAGLTGIYNNSLDIATNTININAGSTGIYNNAYDISRIQTLYLKADGTIRITGSLLPDDSGLIDLGSSGNMMNNVYSNSFYVDTINELTTTNGVNIDGVLIKDGGGTLTGTLNSRSIIPTTTSTYNLGSATYSYYESFTDSCFVGNGTVGNPSISFIGDQTMGFFRHATDTIGLGIAGFPKFLINLSDMSSRMNIVPYTDATFNLGSSISYWDNTYTNYLYISPGSAPSPAIAFGGETNTGIYWTAINSLGIATGGTNRLTIGSTQITSGRNFLPSSDYSYYLGSSSYSWITTYTGSVRCGVGSVSSASIASNTDTNTGIYWPSADNLGFTVGGVNRLNIGTTAIVPALDFYPAVNNTYDLGSSSYHWANGYIDFIQCSTSAGASTTTPNKISLWGSLYGFSILSSTLAYIAPTTASHKFYVAGTLEFQISATYNYSNNHFVPYVDNTFTCGSSGNRWKTIYAKDGLINTSDARMKKSIEPINLGLSFIESLKPVSYKWIDTITTDEETGEITTIKHTRNHLGLLAQEIKESIEQAGHDLNSVDIIDNDFLVDGEGNDCYGVRYHALIPILIQSIKELSEQVKELKTEVNILKSNLI